VSARWSWKMRKRLVEWITGKVIGVLWAKRITQKK
jgi:hypothetical protein